jgi:putative glycosyltransferase (TIGR04372 family)
LPPLLELFANHRERGWTSLEKAGIPKGSWFVCVHAREAGFYNDANSQTGRFRNADIASYELAIREITARGGWVIRMGESSVKPLPALERTFDYARSEMKSDWMDVFLSAECRFFLGVGSGLMNVPSIFGRPCALTNWTAFYSVPCYARDLFILKHPRMKPESRALTWKEWVKPPFTLLMDDDLQALGFDMIDNSPEEIRDLCVEMLDRLDGTLVYSEQDQRLQARAREILDAPHSTGSQCRIGASFLRQHAATYLP